jgi:hypothetical protein
LLSAFVELSAPDPELAVELPPSEVPLLEDPLPLVVGGGVVVPVVAVEVPPSVELPLDPLPLVGAGFVVPRSPAELEPSVGVELPPSELPLLELPLLLPP